MQTHAEDKSQNGERRRTSLRDVRELKIGQSTRAGMLRIVDRYRNNPGNHSSSDSMSADSSYRERVGNETIIRIVWPLPILRAVGPNLADRRATFLLETGHLCLAWCSVGIEGAKERGDWPCRLQQKGSDATARVWPPGRAIEAPAHRSLGLPRGSILTLVVRYHMVWHVT